MQPLTISDAPLRIRPITGGDVEAIYRGCQDPVAASLALAERLGMRAEGLRRGYWPAREPAAPRRDTWLYGLVPSDPGWPTRP